jgi:hypothetical protein
MQAMHEHQEQKQHSNYSTRGPDQEFCGGTASRGKFQFDLISEELHLLPQERSDIKQNAAKKIHPSRS